MWTPTDAGAFADGRHGFTTGPATLLSAAGDTLYAGVYLTMWRLEPDGRWRVVLDTGADAWARAERAPLCPSSTFV